MNTQPLLDADYNRLDELLDDLRQREDETPQWEFCEGFLAALACCRRSIPSEEWLPVLLSDDKAFASSAQREEFLDLWQRRMHEVRSALDTPVESLDHESAYSPEIMDVRGAVAALPPEERAGIPAEEIPAFAQVWALGFMYAIENWPEEWQAPKDREAAKWHDLSLQAIVAITEDDTGEPTISPLGDDGPPSVSTERLNAYAEALWAVYDLREIWRQIGPRVQQVLRSATPGRNDPCTCGSGLKYKKCCGA